MGRKKKMHVEVTGRGNPRETELKIDGESVAFVGLNLDWKSFEVPIATIELPYLDSDVDAGMQVVLNPATTRVLKHMGWSPPIEDDPGVNLDAKGWKVIALLLLASGGSIAVPENIMVEANFSRLAIQLRLEDDKYIYSVIEITPDDERDPE
jgi:hypothetical protein